MCKDEFILETVVTEFPKHRKEILELYNESTIFIEVCEDYVLCLDSIARQKSKKNKLPQKEINDLKWALEELRTELLSRLEGTKI